jgi:hypothetical protein
VDLKQIIVLGLGCCMAALVILAVAGIYAVLSVT